MKHSIIGVDLAKDVIQICEVRRGRVISNKEIPAHDFTSWLATTKKATIVFESCATSNYWKQEAIKYEHDGRIISAKLVARIRQNQKTDKNDALAVVQASQLIDIQFVQGKTFAQQELQSLMRMRELTVQQHTASRQQIKSLLLEFNIKTGPKYGGLQSIVDSVLEDAENEFSDSFREGLHLAWKNYETLATTLDDYDELLAKTIRLHPECSKLTALEGVSTINAINLYISLGTDEMGTFKSGRDAAACIGVTPIQHSSGGKTQLGTIGKHVKNARVRSQLISGAMSVVRQVAMRLPRTEKEQWLKQLIERRGKKCAAVALANKTVRTAFALLTQGTTYKAQPLTG